MTKIFGRDYENVIDSLGSGGATIPPGPTGSGALYGARYQDNTCYAWGDVQGMNVPPPGKCTVFSDFGVDSVHYIGVGQYAVYLNTVDPYTGSRVNFAHGFSVTATPVIYTAGVPSLFIQVTPLGVLGLPPNAFEINLGKGGGYFDGRVMFHVFGRE